MSYQHHLLFGKKNFTIVLIGIGLMVLGFLLMVGGGDAPDLTTTYPEDTLYGFRRTVLAPFFVLAGLGAQIFAIFSKSDAPAPPEKVIKKGSTVKKNYSKNKKRAKV